MNKKLTNYVNGLFSDYPNSKKARELKEEILSNLTEHFQDVVNNGASENEAYTEAISKLGNIDELLQSIMPDKDLSEKINLYKKKHAKFTSIGVMLYILGAAIFLAIPGVAAVTNKGDIYYFAYFCGSCDWTHCFCKYVNSSGCCALFCKKRRCLAR